MAAAGTIFDVLGFIFDAVWVEIRTHHLSLFFWCLIVGLFFLSEWQQKKYKREKVRFQIIFYNIVSMCSQPLIIHIHLTVLFEKKIYM